ncbi:hypothetical protein Kpol_1016p14 [Vanderwaltozyma polyspora DSM 70294]|uniref:ATP-dependent RNA helicase DBP7 n=1 Tax=Vanderwaltozyma polyspora (strain ATCC 22028 / DSM 70294 / BCRC 21397 / CBS 2163 / NBRC 10782 / NRRL Y-8283 / UCD 57-17) TaxID=436907 RepID=DBP7_VANPO|nr:uncharacterized protein Kpol_1016p14 [Vanderwaltozyma polyspora DSM 70294]A7TNT1.1 RecName: Full=ATP-dependent RNA helicase DBP7 [Vanderwaltozyma polyspora DSM 70294]EDO16074.1 hypothetical protein Kpol_1016p14 [Vanderwaltozyma polyspora DSM 70294]
MIEDDGMLLNFSTDTTEDNNDSKFNSGKVTGGRWKERRKLKMMMEGREPVKRKTFEELENSDMDTNKKPKSDSSGRKSYNQQSNNESVKDVVRPVVSKVNPSQVNTQIVSSLFTAARQVETSVNINEHDDKEEINPSNAPLAADNFDSLKIEQQLVNHLNEKMRIQKPTSIQKLVLPQLLSSKNNDLFIHAQTGSGKTLAFALPILSKILSMKTRVDRKSGCFAIFITPTRELATQIYHVLSELTNCCHYLVPCLLIGGESKKSEKARLRKGCNFIIGTPGRILDHFQNTQSVKEQLAVSLRYVVLDEADKLMELGFEETLTDILKLIHDISLNTSVYPQLPSRIMHILCSATSKGSVTKLGNVALQNYKMISNSHVTNELENATVPDQLLQKIAIVPPKLRLVTLAATLDSIHRKHIEQKKKKLDYVSRTVVFLSCSDSVNFHFEAFSSSDANHRNLVGESARLLTKGNDILPSFDPENDPDFICYKLHGSLSQQIRSSTLQHFSKTNENVKGKHLVLFCTDVASRGLDLPEIGTVIELDPPFAVEDHLHRIGRTARAGKHGESLLFLLPGEEEGYMEYIKPYHTKGWKLVNYTNDLLKPSFQNVNVKRSDKETSKNVEEWDTNATTWHLNVERRVLEDSSFKDIAMKGYASHIRAYATHISKEKKFFNVKCLHLGHLAKSFALRERPKTMGLQNTKNGGEAKKNSKESAKNKMFRLARMAVKQSSGEFNY